MFKDVYKHLPVLQKKNASHIPKTLGLFSDSGISWEHNNEMYIIFNYTIFEKTLPF